CMLSLSAFCGTSKAHIPHAMSIVVRRPKHLKNFTFSHTLAPEPTFADSFSNYREVSKEEV
ncbi:MAG: hypothetical protein WBM41_07260, partial [Arenicellales bacterium]